MSPKEVDKAGKALAAELANRDPSEERIKEISLALFLGIARNLAVLAAQHVAGSGTGGR